MDHNTIRVELTESSFNEEVEKSAVPVVVEFTTPWSGASHIMAPILEQLAQEYSGRLRFGIVDISVYQAIGERFGFHAHDDRTLPSLLFFKEGTVIDQVIKVVSRELLEKKIAAFASPDSANPEGTGK